MAYTVSIRSRTKSGAVKTRVFPCTHLEVTNLLDDVGADAGYRIELLPSEEFISLPEDGFSAFVVSNETSRTVSAYHWPPREHGHTASVSEPVASAAGGAK